MANLTYMIFKENTKEKEENKHCINQDKTSSSSRAHELISSFQAKPAHAVRSSLAKHGSIGTAAPSPPRLRELIKESGFLEEFGPQRDIPLVHEEEESHFRAGDRGDKHSARTIDKALQGVMEEVLTIDGQKLLPCTYQNDSSLAFPDASSITSDSLENLPFEFIPNYGSQIDPWYSDPSQISPERRKFQMCNPPPTEDSQPSRSSTDFGKRNTGRPSSTQKRTDASLIENEVGGHSDSAHDCLIPSQIPRVNSAQSFGTVVSALTFPQEIMSPQLCIDPQCDITLEQERQGDIDRTERSRRHSPAPNAPTPPARHDTSSTGVSADAPLRKANNIDSGEVSIDPFEITPNFGFPSHDGQGTGDCRSTIEIKSECTRRKTSLSPSPPQGPSSSPSHRSYRNSHLPDFPGYDSDPQLFPANLLCSMDNRSVTDESIVGPFVGPDAVQRRYKPIPTTPDNDANPLQFPHGIEYSCTLASKTMSIRVRHAPRQLVYILNRKERGHTGFYSGPINRNNQLHGNGIFWFSTGDLYLGQFFENKLHGFGALSIRQESGPNRVMKGFFVRNEYVGENLDSEELQ